MPIVFRCSNCGQKLSITSRKAGKEVTCPECVHRITVPTPEPTSKQEKPQPAAVAESTPPSQPQDEDSNLRLQPVQNSHKPLDDTQAWVHHPNPWLNEDEEDEDFSLNAPPLEESGLDMTPMVDVTFLLLIFFMVTASFSTQKSLETAPPEPDEDGAAQSLTMEDLEEESVVVDIDEEDNIRVDDTPVSGLAALRDVLTAKIAEGKTEMLIEAHENSRHGTVVQVTDVGLDANMQRIRRTTKKGED